MINRNYIWVLIFIFLIGVGIISTRVTPVFPEMTGNNHHIYLPIAAKPLETWMRVYDNDTDNNAGTVIFANSEGGNFLLVEGAPTYPKIPGVIKLAHDGSIIWQRDLDINEGYDLNGLPTSDGGLIISFVGFYGQSNKYTATLIKLDHGGNIEWQRNFGGPYRDLLLSLVEARDGGFIFAGNISLNGISSHTWVVKVDKNGATLWEEVYLHHGLHDYGYSIKETKSGDFIIVGSEGRWLDNDDVPNGSFFNDNLFVLKISKDGDVIWEKLFDGGFPEVGQEILETIDGDYVVAGYTESSGAGGDDIWVLRLNHVGDVIWQKTYGGAGDDRAYSMIKGVDGGFIIAGYTESFGAGMRDGWIIKLNGSGDVVWENTYGGSHEDEINGISSTGDKYLVAGYSNSFNMRHNQDSDAWAFKIDSTGNISNCAQVQESHAVVMNTNVASYVEQIARPWLDETGSAATDISFVNGLWSESLVCPAR